MPTPAVPRQEVLVEAVLKGVPAAGATKVAAEKAVREEAAGAMKEEAVRVAAAGAARVAAAGAGAGEALAVPVEAVSAGDADAGNSSAS